MTSQQESRLLARIGLAAVVVVALVAALLAFNPWARSADPRLALTVDTPYVGQGVAADSPVLLHGVRVGEVDTVASLPGGGVRLQLRLQPGPATGLTDTIEMDYRPANYFGVTGINLIQPDTAGQPLRDGMTLTLAPRGNYTMQAFLSRLGEITGGVVTPQLVDVLERVTRYVDGLNPMMETVLLVANSVTKVQTVSAGQLVRSAAGITVPAPTFADALTDLVDRLDHTGLDVSEEFFQQRFLPTVELASTGMFAAVGRLLSSHVRELLPVTEVVRTLTGPIPGIAQTENISDTLVELRTRFERMYEGGPDQRALRVRVVLDSIPGVAAPLQAMVVP